MDRQPTSFNLYRRVLHECRSCWGRLAAIALVNLLATPLALLLPLPLKLAIDSAMGREIAPRFMIAAFPFLGRWNGLSIAVIALLGIAVLMSVQSWLVWYLQTYTGEKLVWDFRSRLLEHVQRLSMSFHDRQGAMESAYRIQHDASAIQYIGIQGLIPAFSAVLTLAGMLFVSLRVDPALALIALGIVPPLAFLSYSCSGLVRRRSGTIKELDSSA